MLAPLHASVNCVTVTRDSLALWILDTASRMSLIDDFPFVDPNFLGLLISCAYPERRLRAFLSSRDAQKLEIWKDFELESLVDSDENAVTIFFLLTQRSRLSGPFRYLEHVRKGHRKFYRGL